MKMIFEGQIKLIRPYTLRASYSVRYFISSDHFLEWKGGTCQIAPRKEDKMRRGKNRIKA
jgi:hypothetical protein